MNVTSLAGLRRRIFSALLSLGTLWTVSVTAGSENAASAARALREAASQTAMRLEFGAYGEMSPAAVLALSETPLLYSARDNADLFPEAEPDDAPSADETVPDSVPAPPPAETPSEPVKDAVPLQEAVQEPVRPVDNGVRARTLIPKSADGYLVSGRVYISSSRKTPLDTQALRDTFDAELTGEGPQILILHSHGSEAYTPAPGTDLVWWGDSRTTDFRYSVVRVGDEMASVFENAGISVLHDRTLYDYPDYSGSYDRSLSAIESYLAQYPSIRFVLDVHRDYIADSAGNPYKVISEIDGVGTAAQLTLVMGSDGSGLSHPRWMENLKLAVAIQEQILSDYPTLMRPMLLRKSRYNQHATTGSLLVEVGAAGNSPEEALLSARIFAEEMTEVLQARSK
ncbi:MAG: stage II sporulation protein P [Oscillibacter sp.]|nr:stage II sporulation protein P [Oscillibacter sp.]